LTGVRRIGELVERGCVQIDRGDASASPQQLKNRCATYSGSTSGDDEDFARDVHALPFDQDGKHSRPRCSKGERRDDGCGPTTLDTMLNMAEGIARLGALAEAPVVTVLSRAFAAAGF